MSLKWHTEKRRVRELIPWERNPRVMTEKQVKDLTESLTKFNLMSIPVIDLDGKIISGHQRMKILHLLGRGNEEIDVRVPNRKLTEEEFKEANLRENKNIGEWDWDLLANMFDADALLEVGFSEKELQIAFDMTPKDGEERPPEMNLKDTFQLIVELETEEKLSEAFDRFTKEGYKCRVLIL